MKAPLSDIAECIRYARGILDSLEGFVGRSEYDVAVTAIDEYFGAMKQFRDMLLKKERVMDEAKRVAPWIPSRLRRPEASPPPAPSAVRELPKAPQEPERDYDDDDFAF